MALVSLPNGKVIDVDLLWYLALSDEEYQNLMAQNSGAEISNPFFGSSLTRPFEDLEDEEPEIDLDIELEPDDV